MPNPTTPERTFLEAIDEALIDAFEADDKTIFFGTSVPKRLLDTFGADRVRQCPISEPSITGAAVGAAIRGSRPVAWLRNVAFSYVAFDAIMNHAAKLHYMTAGQLAVPLLIRITTGAGTQSAAQHSQTPHGMFCGVAGLRVVAPGDAQTAYGAIRRALESNGPTVMMESQRIERVAGPIDKSAAVRPTVSYRDGQHLTIVAISGYLPIALAAAEELAAQGVDCGVVHPVRISPLDMNPIIRSVETTRRLLLLDEAPADSSVAANVIARLHDTAQGAGSIAIERLHGPDTPIPFSPVLEETVFPSMSDVLAAAHRLLR